MRSDTPSSWFVRSKVRKAQKVYECAQCRQAIPVGETYLYEVGVWEGDFFTLRNCGACRKYRIQRIAQERRKCLES